MQPCDLSDLAPIDLKLLKTANFDVGPDHYPHMNPEEPRVAPDETVFVQTLGCGCKLGAAIWSRLLCSVCN
jgi:hypothetical protein